MSIDVLTAAEQAIARFAQTKACYTCSFQAEDVVLLHLLLRRNPSIPVLFLETGYHFAATYAYRDRLASEWNLNLVNLKTDLSVAAQETQFGRLYESDPARCCQMRKVEPLMKGLEPYDVWFTGLRREQSPTRANLQVEERHRLPSGREIAKISPLAAWTWQDVWSYLSANEIPHLPLYDTGYTSIGCEPCTARPAEGESLRSGRWGGKKLECGIHTFTGKDA
ncbi:MAG: phosphoadenylyl-sulfate reductase [Bryobacterales bacterium]|nr:phosphoadenylyl-sulfate reductase [Bryobacterales bacterium]